MSIFLKTEFGTYRLSHKIRIENLSQLGWAGQAMKDSDADIMGQPVGMNVRAEIEHTILFLKITFFYV